MEHFNSADSLASQSDKVDPFESEAIRSLSQGAQIESVPRVDWRQDPEYRKLAERAVKNHRLHGLIGLTLISFAPPLFGINLLGLIYQTILLHPDVKVKWIKDRHPDPTKLTETTLRIYSEETLLGMDVGYIDVSSEDARFLGTQTSFTIPTLTKASKRNRFEWHYIVAGTRFRAEFSAVKELPSFRSTSLHATNLVDFPPTLVQTEPIITHRLLRYTIGFIGVGLLVIISQTFKPNTIHQELNFYIRNLSLAFLGLLLVGLAIAQFRKSRNSRGQREYLARTFPSPPPDELI